MIAAFITLNLCPGYFVSICRYLLPCRGGSRTALTTVLSWSRNLLDTCRQKYTFQQY